MSTELQALNSSRDMSATESFSSNPVQAQTDVDVTVPVGPLYQTVTDANVAHRQYHTDQIKSTVPQPMGYAVPSDPLPANEYDLINEKQVSGQGGVAVAHPPGRRLEADNVLYAGQKEAEEQFKHATLRLDKDSNRYSGNINSPLMEPEEKTGICTSKICLMFLVFFLIATIIIAVAALALAVVLLLGVHNPSCNCESSLTDITMRLQSLEDKLEVPTSSGGGGGSGSDAIADLQTAVTSLTSEVSSLSDRVDQSEMQTSINNITLSVHDGCNTTIQGTCFIPVSNPFNACDIPTDSFFSPTDLGSEDHYIADIQCRRNGDSDETNPFIGSVQRNAAGHFRCLCYVISLSSGIPNTHAVECAMYVTRCPLTQDFIIST